MDKCIECIIDKSIGSDYPPSAHLHHFCEQAAELGGQLRGSCHLGLTAALVSPAAKGGGGEGGSERRRHSLFGVVRRCEFRYGCWYAHSDRRIMWLSCVCKRACKVG